MSSFHPKKAATQISALLLEPELAAHTVRLEAIAQLAIAHGKGKRSPTNKNILQLFKLVGDTAIANVEDPPEDVFVYSVHDDTQNYRIIQGPENGSGFHLQRFINIISRMPANQPYVSINKSIKSLLKISETICERAKLSRHLRGSSDPIDALSPSYFTRQKALIRHLHFTPKQLVEMNIDEHDLLPFVLGDSEFSHVGDKWLGDSPLIQKPLVRNGNGVSVILPTAISLAIRYFLIGEINTLDMLPLLETSLADEYESTFSECRLIGTKVGAPIQFSKTRKTTISNVVFECDHGRQIHFCMYVDDFTTFDKLGFDYSAERLNEIYEDVEASIDHVQSDLTSKQGFKEGLTLIVSCGWGRSIARQLPVPKNEKWRCEFIDAYDLVTFSWISGFTSLDLWRLLDIRDKMESQDIHFVNLSGILNLYAWAKHTNFHMIPPDELKEISWDGSSPFLAYIPTNMLENSRYDVQSGWNEHLVTDPEMETNKVLVRRIVSDWHFEEDKEIPLFASVTHLLKARLVALVETTNSSIWIEINTSENLGRDFEHKLWDAVGKWVAQLIRILELSFPRYFRKLPSRIFLHFDFRDTAPDYFSNEIPSESELRKLISITHDSSLRTTSLQVEEGFLAGLAQHGNVAEVVLLREIVLAIFSETGNVPNDADLERIIAETAPSTHARNLHIFPGRTYRDFSRAYFKGNPVAVSSVDDALSRKGLAWLIDGEHKTRRIDTKSECTNFLNSVVDAIWEETRELISRFSRQVLIHRLLENYEKIQIGANRWRTTFPSILDFHKDKLETFRVVNHELSLLDGAALGTRIAIEIANCESDLNSDLLPGDLDLSRLICNAFLMAQFGGWSDSIQFEAMEPEIDVLLDGDLLLNNSFYNSIVAPYGLELGRKSLIRKAEEYADLYIDPATITRDQTELDPAFLSAWNDEFNVSPDHLGSFLAAIEDATDVTQSPIFMLSRSQIKDLPYEHSPLTSAQIDLILEHFALRPRETWNHTPANFEPKDWYPWRYGRSLSLVSRPIVQIETAEDSLFVLSPALIAEGFAYVLSGAYVGSFDERRFSSKSMKSWVGTARNSNGHLFNEKIANELIKNGWQAHPNIEVSHILNHKAPELGDVDVLAWDNQTGRVLVIECKALFQARNPGEISRQLWDFRGMMDDTGEPDRLRRHLDRFEYLESNRAGVQKFTQIETLATLEMHLVFSEVVPMAFSEGTQFQNVSITIADNIKQI